MTLLLILILFSVSTNGFSQEATLKKAYEMRYVSLDSARIYTRKAYNDKPWSSKTSEERSLALGNTAFMKYMEMDYDSAGFYYQKSLEEANDNLTRLLADIGLMKICNIVSANKDFYQYKLDAEEELNTFDGNPDNIFWKYAVSEYFFTMASYYSNTQQEEEARRMLHEASERKKFFETDAAQLSRFFQLQSSIGPGNIDGSLKLQYLVEAYVAAEKGHLLYMQACAMQQIASFVIGSNKEADVARSYRALLHLDDVETEQIGITLANRALEAFRTYGSIYSRALAYLTISDYYLRSGNCEVALDSANKALELTVQYDDEKRAVPKEWIAKIREQLSIIYAGLGDKQQSDFNRNIYLDLLEETREDKMLEQRRDMLEAEQQKLSWILYAVYTLASLLAVTMIILTVVIRRRRRQENRERAEIQEKEKAILQQRLLLNKKNYIDKCTCLSIVGDIYPLICRGAVDADRLAESGDISDSERLDYVKNIFSKIEEYNDSLSHLITIKQGTIKLHIEQFPLQTLFDTVSLNRGAFERAGITLDIRPSDATVKADRALTLFMINTLLDNARKFTDEGGAVTLDAEPTDKYVEISVTDTGSGMTPEQLQQMMSTGARADGNGSGFGIMNCKGIISKYRKTSKLFDVCKFLIESRKDEGTRVSFRLPRIVTMFVFLFCFSSLFADTADSLLNRAHLFADSMYFANVDRHYEDAVIMADSALDCLNRHYQQNNSQGTQVLVLNGGRYMPELDWWRDSLMSDYNTILDVRNEVAVAALALQRRDLYKYNNNIYTRLYKLRGQDLSLEDYCRTMDSTNQRIRYAIYTIALLILAGILIYIFVHRYFKRRNRELQSEDENRLIALEDHNLHVENLILDNCLSSLKHETMYYPAKILNIADSLDSADDCVNMAKLANYYKTVFATLSTQARQQLKNTLFKRQTVYAVELCEYLRGLLLDSTNITFIYDENTSLKVSGDRDMLCYFMDNIASLIKENKSKGTVSMTFEESDGFIKFILTDDRLHRTEDECHRLFSPDNLRYDSSSDRLHGMQYLIMKQIIREHDDNSSKRGCRMFATENSLIFTLSHN